MMNPLGLRKSIRHLNRYQEILKIFVKYGFWDVVEKIKIGLLFDISKKILPRMEKKEYAVLGTPVRLRMAFEELGPTFIKLGQMLSVRPDLIPPQIAQEFTKLQDEVAPVSFEKLKPLLEETYSEDLLETFAEFEETALAAASMAQVHRARLKSGEDVAVKILRPNIHQIIKTDLEILFNLAELIAKYVPESELYDPVGIITEFSRTIRKEQNLVLEGRNIDIFRRYLQKEEYIKIPVVYWEYSSEKILVTEFIQGIKISDLAALDAAEIDRKQVAENGAKAILKQVFEFGLFHADPHPGNLFVLPGNVIVPVDFGMVGRIDEDMKEDLLNILRGIVDKDSYRITRVLLNIGLIEDQINFRNLQHDLLDYLDRYYGVPLNQLDTAQLLNEFMELVRNYRIKLPPDMVMMGKALTISEAVGRELDPEFNMFDLLIPYTKKMFYQRWNPAYHYRHLNRLLDASIDLLKSLPEDIRNILLKLKRDQITVRFQHQGLEQFTRELDRSSNRISFALIIAALIIGSSVVIQLDKGPFLWGYPALGIIGYVLASFLGFWLIIAILRSGKL
ncbi:MAG TPA: AarF/ABC1/UbiB kinase family protein [Caldithrix sp.]|nr:AarF/ABC1/UbiB kinase family protein [Caldithrix sp.]